MGENKQHVEMMLLKIAEYTERKISFNNFVENLWALYELIDENDKDENFINSFHKYWDYLEEIRAVNKTNEYKEIIDNQIIVKLREFLKTII